ncbi:dihydroorotate dehydrogenase electron transfer subunit [Aequitasia blattaphilus]|uniref:Dihydroorotate dehydrogenase B (NAD(+)), electron transfer subunit n=1 Tax=Aequitasia blattaphilus TaxID=2949332 RepID=A0ABT1E9V3_9FIRM|nr:dihydroorotate dehydrogenase electron transfer subunit [Aequitasia blattaphilus]MCP1102634.1 dihydroorotate dehydrogenase electron transfer subunit [Aequitasia blattaphilus]MCR8615274.1 dihydroorotate dehydrogenase electron transfer subunit [Aequitasia blattaphilus]
MKRKKEIAKVLSQKEIAKDIFDLWIESQSVTADGKAGQFVSLYTGDESRLLPRPISICEIDSDRNALRLVYRVTGEHTGTKIFSKMTEGDEIEILGPLGNGFDTSIPEDAILIGGGIGIPPMLELAKERSGKSYIVTGFKDSTFLMEDLQRWGEVAIATEDGSAGTKGTVLDAIRDNGIKADVLYACGPTPMLKAVKEYAKEEGIEKVYLSLEEKMACGVGACLACVCKSKEVDSHTHVKNKRVCKEGPVFSAWEVEF